MGNTLVWWELEILTKLPFSTPMGQAFGPRPPALQYVDKFYYVCPHILHIRSNPWELRGELACGRMHGAEVED